MFHPTKLPHTLAWGSWSLGLAGTGAYCSTYYMVQAMEYYQVLVLPTIYYYIYGPTPMEYYQVLVLPTICRYYVLNTVVRVQHLVWASWLDETGQPHTIVVLGAAPRPRMSP